MWKTPRRPYGSWTVPRFVETRSMWHQPAPGPWALALIPTSPVSCAGKGDTFHENVPNPKEWCSPQNNLSNPDSISSVGTQPFLNEDRISSSTRWENNRKFSIFNWSSVSFIWQYNCSTGLLRNINYKQNPLILSKYHFLPKGIQTHKSNHLKM